MFTWSVLQINKEELPTISLELIESINIVSLVQVSFFKWSLGHGPVIILVTGT